MQRFDTPGFVDDFETDAQRAAWGDFYSEHLTALAEGDHATETEAHPQFFNALTHPPAADVAILPILWNAFPRQVRLRAASDKQRWRAADKTRDVQDEYCEWSVLRDTATQKIRRVTFTCEGPEYWSFLHEHCPDRLLSFYRDWVGPHVQLSDLLDEAGEYNPRNRHNVRNTGEIVHMIQNSNSLIAAIILGAEATIRRRDDAGREVTDAQTFVECGAFGEKLRNSDPHIGEMVNGLARRGAQITINNPIGLYLHEFSPTGWETPDGADPRDFWTHTRGRNGYFVRAVFEVPAARGYMVGDIKTGSGRNIEFGGQIADCLTIRIEGLATRFGQFGMHVPQPCVATGMAESDKPGKENRTMPSPRQNTRRSATELPPELFTEESDET